MSVLNRYVTCKWYKRLYCIGVEAARVDRPEAINKKALSVLNRVKEKLTGRTKDNSYISPFLTFW